MQAETWKGRTEVDQGKKNQVQALINATGLWPKGHGMRLEPSQAGGEFLWTLGGCVEPDVGSQAIDCRII